MANITQQEQERLKLLQEIELIEKRINAQNEKAAISKSKEAKRLKAQLDEEKKQLDKFKEQLGVVDPDHPLGKGRQRLAGVYPGLARGAQADRRCRHDRAGIHC